MHNFISQIYYVYIINLIWLNNQFNIYLLPLNLSFPFFPFFPLIYLLTYPPLPTAKAKTLLAWLLRLQTIVSISVSTLAQYILYRFHHSTLLASFSSHAILIALCFGHVTYVAWNAFLPSFPSRLCKAFPLLSIWNALYVSLYPQGRAHPSLLLLLSDLTLPHGLAKRSPVCISC